MKLLPALHGRYDSLSREFVHCRLNGFFHARIGFERRPILRFLRRKKFLHFAENLSAVIASSQCDCHVYRLLKGWPVGIAIRFEAKGCFHGIDCCRPVAIFQAGIVNNRSE